jgi:hypothetical protein
MSNYEYTPVFKKVNYRKVYPVLSRQGTAIARVGMQGKEVFSMERNWVALFVIV